MSINDPRTQERHKNLYKRKSEGRLSYSKLIDFSKLESFFGKLGRRRKGQK